MQLKKWTVAVLSLLAMHGAVAQQKPSQQPLLLIGASFAQGKTPFNNGVAPLGGIAVGFGTYLSLGQALTRNEQLPGYVINEAQAGAGTFAHPYCAPGAVVCGPAAWDSYMTQLERALKRVALPPTFTSYNAKYVVVTIGNDCLHADASGIPQSLSVPCTLNDMHATVDRLVALGNFAMSKGVTPIFDVYPKYGDLDLPLFQSSFGLQWVIGEQDYTMFRDLIQSRLAAELPGAIQLDIWQEFAHIGDGIHPNQATARKAARVLATHLRKLDQ